VFQNGFALRCGAESYCIAALTAQQRSISVRIALPVSVGAIEAMALTALGGHSFEALQQRELVLSFLSEA
tara:strand:- start:2699 stop:2908 length:210 start_codon:yes stop_codon:yes gene_type:complete